jgi:CheY-like chemotaxis protein
MDLIELRDMPVLVVEDSATSRQILEQMLTQWRMKPSGADGGRAAFDRMSEAANDGKPYRLALIDTSMSAMEGLTLIERIRTDPRLKKTAIILMAPAGERIDQRQRSRLDIATLLSKPIRQSDLMDAIITAIGPSKSQKIRLPRRPQHSLTKASQSLHVLLAEDNALNQKLVVRLLEKRGHKVTVAANGREALDAFNRNAHEPFDLLIMDVQMPDIGGLQATAIIREREKGTEEHLPIVALTAHATKEDRERCLSAGMDAYITKPVTAMDLFETIESIASGAETTKSLGSEAASHQVLDEKALWDRVDHDAKLLDTMTKLFSKDCPKKMEELKRLLHGGDMGTLAAAAHTLAGSVGNFTADKAVAAGRNLEKRARENDRAGAERALVELEREIEALKKALSRLKKESRRS